MFSGSAAIHAGACMPAAGAHHFAERADGEASDALAQRNQPFRLGGLGHFAGCGSYGGSLWENAVCSKGGQEAFCDSSSTMFQKLPDWFNNFDDGESTSPASDLRGDHRSASGASDATSGSCAGSSAAEAASTAGWACSDEDEGHFSTGSPPLWGPPAVPGRSSSMPAQNAWSTPLPGYHPTGPPPPWCAQEPALMAAWEAQLVDVDPEEGKRRGGELLSMLFEHPAAGPADAAPPHGVAAPRLPGGRGAMSNLPPPPPPPSRPPPPPQEEVGGGASACALRKSAAFTAVCEAARRAFGDRAAGVSATPNGGFAVRLGGGAGASSDDVAAGLQAGLDTLMRALKPLLGPEAVHIEVRGGAAASAEAASADLRRPNAAPPLCGDGVSSLCPLTGASKAAGIACDPPRLTIWFLCEGEEYPEDLCWDFARRGFCPRGPRCHWLHQPPATYPVDVEVLA